jgi:hypothetical protein
MMAPVMREAAALVAPPVLATEATLATVAVLGIVAAGARGIRAGTTDLVVVFPWK